MPPRSAARFSLAPPGMEAIVLCGIQASGKTTFYRERFADTHVRVSLDMLRTRRRERILVAACIEALQPFVVDNTNPTRAERARYVEPARAAGFRVVCYFFESEPRAALGRNARRTGRALVPPAGLLGTLKRLERPLPDEGFDALFRVRLVPADAGAGERFEVEPMAGGGG